MVLVGMVCMVVVSLARKASLVGDLGYLEDPVHLAYQACLVYPVNLLGQVGLAGSSLHTVQLNQPDALSCCF